MTIDEAIRHAEEVAESKKTESETAEIQGCDRYALKCEECASEHRQLAEWLKDYKRLKEQEPSGDLISREAVFDLIADYDLSMGQVVRGIHSLPSVKQEPCEDAISREAVLKIQAKYAEHMGATKFWQMRDDIKTLSSVKPQEPTTRNCFGCKYSKDNHNAGTEECHLCMWENQYTPQEPKTGHWILQPSNKEQGERDFIWWKCSECGQIIYSETEKDRREYHAFCGRCGAKMIEPQERSEE